MEIWLPDAEEYNMEVGRRRAIISCSTGRAQGFALAQFWPELFDRIVAGSLGNW